MTDIQKARDVLKKWREEVVHVNSVVPLVDGTAGNPALLDAIDMELEYGIHAPNGTTKRIAAAILSADERMQQ